MKLKNILTACIALILVACVSIPAQVSTQSIQLTNTLPSPSMTFTPKLTSTKTPTSTITLTTRPTTPTLPVLLTPDPTLIQDFAGTYLLLDPTGSSCKLEIKRDATFSIEFLYMSLFEKLDGTIFFADGRFFPISSKRSESKMPRSCFPQALIPVYWRPRRYLFVVVVVNDVEIMAHVVSEFCENIKDGIEPRNRIGDDFYFLRETDITAKVIGLPVRQDGGLLCP